MQKSFLKKRIAVLLISVTVTALVTALALFFTARNYTIYFRPGNEYSEVTAEIDNPDIIELKSAVHKNDYWVLTFKALSPGETSFSAVGRHAENDELFDRMYDTVHVTRFGTIIEKGFLMFDGYAVLCFGIALIFMFIFSYLFGNYRRRKKTDFFSHETVLDLGLSGFFLLQSLIFIGLTVVCLIYPADMRGEIVFMILQYALTLMVIALMPLFVIFSFALVISNVWLIRHEGLIKTNLLGILLAFLIFGGVAASIITAFINIDFFAFEPKTVLISAVRTVISALFLYFSMILFAAVYCCVIAPARKQTYDKDFIVILGCAIRKDGTLYPLIKGRTDKAIDFSKAQKEATGREVIFIPSGGQGSDEVIAEGEAVRRYLISQGIPEEMIMAETESTSTLENFKYSKKIIDTVNPDGKVLFSTTNYHVFRGGILARNAGVEADGIGSKTKWYFWPNAEIREFVAILSRSRKLHLIICFLLTVSSLITSNVGNLINYILK